MSSSPTTQPWRRRLRRVVLGAWLPATVLTVLCCIDSVLSALHSTADLVLVPGLALFALLAVRGRAYPALCGAAAAGVLVLSSLVVNVTGAVPYLQPFGPILPTENIGGVLLVLYVHRRLPAAKAAPVTGLLASAFLVSLHLRPYEAAWSESQLVAFGVLECVLAVGTGSYLRGQSLRLNSTPLVQLLRRQWPMMAGLSVLLFVEFGNGGIGSAGRLPMLLGAVVLAALAVIAPLRPVESALLGASALAFMGVADRLVGGSLSRTALLDPLPLPLTAVVAAMLLVAFATRYPDVRKACWAVGALVVAALFAVLFAVRGQELSTIAQLLALGALLLALSVGAGMYFRARDGERNRTVHVAVEQAQQTERLALARELHDIVAHHVTGIVVQAQAAQMVAGKQPEAAADALDKIANSGTEALVAMRRLVASMRGAEPAGSSPAEHASTDLHADLSALVEKAGPEVALTLELVNEVPQEVARSALRLVQESLTNAEKHGTDVTHVRVLVRSPHEHLHVRITDNGTGRSTAPVGGSGGYGLVGMRERIELLGGRFSAGPGERAGWRVEAWLPLAEQEAE